MLSHNTIWSAIDRLAELRGMSVSALAKSAGLDSTSFNRSKRNGPDGRPRWPSTESLARILAANDTSLDRFVAMVEMRDFEPVSAGAQKPVPLIGLAQAGSGGFFGDNGLPQGEGWDAVAFPTGQDGEVFAIEVQGESMLPLYRDGDVLIVEPGAQVRKGDRVVVKTQEGEVLAKILQRQTAMTVELLSLNPEHPNRQFARDQIVWIARIVWASQ